MTHIVRSEIALQARDALRECIDRMNEVNEPCDHSANVCWCDWHRALDRALEAVNAINAATRSTN